MPIIGFEDDEGYDSSRERDRRKKDRRRRADKNIDDSRVFEDRSTEFDPSGARYRTSLGNYRCVINLNYRNSLHICGYNRAIKIGLYKNGDPWFGAVNFHYLPGRDVTNLDSLFKMINPKMDIMNGNYFN